MPELIEVHDAAKVRVFGPPAVLDGLTAPVDIVLGRVAPDELVLLGRPGTGTELVAGFETALAGHGARALVVDHTDGWSCFSLVGDDVAEVFARVTQIPFPDTTADPVFLMGRICDVAGKAFVREGRVDILTGAEASAHVHHRLEDALGRVGRREAAVLR